MTIFTGAVFGRKESGGGGGGDGGEFTELRRETLSAAVSLVNFTGLLTDAFNEYLLEYHNVGGPGSDGDLLIRFGNDPTYNTTDYESKFDKSNSLALTYASDIETIGIIIGSPVDDDRWVTGSVIISDSRDASQFTGVHGIGIMKAHGSEFVAKQDATGQYNVNETHDSIQVVLTSGTMSEGIFILKGRNI